MKLKYLPQLSIITLTLGMYLISAACLGSESQIDQENIPPEVGTLFAVTPDGTVTRTATLPTFTLTRSRTPTRTRTSTPTSIPSATEFPATAIQSPTEDLSAPTLSEADRQATLEKRRAEQTEKMLKALVVQGGPPDVPGWDGPSQVTTATPTELVYYLDQDFLMDKLPEIYGDLMPKYGWTRTQANATMMKFTKEGRTATITISLEPDRRVKVSIVIT